MRQLLVLIILFAVNTKAEQCACTEPQITIAIQQANAELCKKLLSLGSLTEQELTRLLAIVANEIVIQETKHRIKLAASLYRIALPLTIATILKKTAALPAQDRHKMAVGLHHGVAAGIMNGGHFGAIGRAFVELAQSFNARSNALQSIAQIAALYGIGELIVALRKYYLNKNRLCRLQKIQQLLQQARSVQEIRTQ
ncbi:hypothetical protein M1466_02010 [Candidatus Dependentiae bacterium]|nr:hypothetical protein [Candidatus Dependentiae bacterium]